MNNDNFSERKALLTALHLQYGSIIHYKIIKGMFEAVPVNFFQGAADSIRQIIY